MDGFRALVWLGLVVALTSAPTVTAAPPAQLTPQQIRDAADSQLATIWSGVQTREAAYFATHNKYAQALRTHSLAIVPADGATVLPDVGVAVPSYQDSSTAWPLSVRTTALRFALAVHEYIRPDGVAGYTGYVWVVIGGHLWMRAQDSGAEQFRTMPWTDAGPWPPVPS
jgi:hypothetical protein